ncbi:MAG: NAD-dependent epimerase/dehydratase family protein, partial [Verrucomicrobia subdivision 3 bacterium]|nr:NAD-dependent epimerase/dehydratase family protein [Limisphaerales bacterium]
TRNLLSRVRCGKFIFTSSSSVYAQNDGSIVTEQSAAEPSSPTSQVLRETEQLLLGSKVPAVILRVTGIYGPGRGFLFQHYLRGEARIHGDGGRFLNMIHRDDVVGAMLAAIDRGRAGEIYNVTDDEPATERDFFAWLAKQLQRELPPRVSEGELISRKRGLTSKRVSNQKLRRELHYELIYPSFREGYAVEIARLHGRAS